MFLAPRWIFGALAVVAGFFLVMPSSRPSLPAYTQKWLVSQGAAFVKSKIDYSAHGGLGVFATGALKQNEQVLCVSDQLVITQELVLNSSSLAGLPKEVLGSLRASSQGPSLLVWFSMMMMFDGARESRSWLGKAFRPYYRTLSVPLSHPVLWDDEDVQRVGFPGFSTGRDIVSSWWDTLHQILNRPGVGGSLGIKNATRDNFARAAALVLSRTYVNPHGVYLSPGMDYFNHDGSPDNTLMLHPRHVDRMICMFASRDYAAGEEVLATYLTPGDSDVLDVLLHYGFVTEYDNYAAVRWIVSIPAYPGVLPTVFKDLCLKEDTKLGELGQGGTCMLRLWLRPHGPGLDQVLPLVRVLNAVVAHSGNEALPGGLTLIQDVVARALAGPVDPASEDKARAGALEGFKESVLEPLRQAHERNTRSPPSSVQGKTAAAFNARMVYVAERIVEEFN
jgi:hypothetical protein